MGSFGVIKNGRKQIMTGGSGSGHTIWNRIKSALTQRPNLWFKDATVTDDSTNNSTNIEILQSVSLSDFNNLPTTADGLYEVDGADLVPFMAENVGYDNTSSGLSATNTQQAIDEVDDRLDSINIQGLFLGSYTFTANSVKDITVDMSSVANAKYVLDLTVTAPTMGAQYINIVRYPNPNSFRVLSSQAQSCQLSASLLCFK